VGPRLKCKFASGTAPLVWICNLALKQPGARRAVKVDQWAARTVSRDAAILLAFGQMVTGRWKEKTRQKSGVS